MDQLVLNLEQLRKKTEGLEKELQDKNCQIEELKSYIDCLKAELVEVQNNEIELPSEPIKVAEMLIDAGYSYKNKLTGTQHIGSLYSKSGLRQIAGHLLLYCNNSEGE